MEQHGGLIATAVGVGVGVGLGLGLLSVRLAAPAPASGAAAGAEVEAELRGLVVDGRDSGVSFDDFPYYLSEKTKLALTSAAYSCLSQKELPKHIRVLANVSRTILLCGTSELYLKSLAEALAHQFNARLLSLDVDEFSRRIQHKYGGPHDGTVDKKSITRTALDSVSGLVGSFNLFRRKDESRGSLDREMGLLDFKTGDYSTGKVPSVRLQVSLLPGTTNYNSEASGCFESYKQNWSLDKKIILRSLYTIISYISESSPIILYIRDVNQFLASSEKACIMFQKILNKLSKRVLIIGSYFLDSDEDSVDLDEGVSALFPYILETKPPKEETHLEKWKTQMKEDKKKIQFRDIRNHISEVLLQNNLECDDLNSIDADNGFMDIANYIEEIMAPAVSYHLMNDKDPEYRNGKLVISSKSLFQGLSIFQESNLGRDTLQSKPEEVSDNEYEKRIRPSVVPANEIDVTFDDIGALTDIKESLQELVMLPLQRPELFNGGLLKQCRGILLFGPPGTGKTMLAKAIANEAGASFLNISVSSITSKWYGTPEKSTRALFSLAAKIAPTIIFLDEVDSMLGRRDNPNEHEVSRNIKNEFMTHWDGLLSKSKERIVVLAATNRPFDLDEAVIRRFEHRIMVGLPTLESRELILKTLLSKEKVKNIDFKELARMTEGYSASDLKNLCVAAAYRPVRELFNQEQERKKDKKEKSVEAKEEQGEKPKNHESEKGNSNSKRGEKDQPETENSREQKSETKRGKKGRPGEDVEAEAGKSITLKPITMDDMRQAKDEVATSFASESFVMNQIKEWNNLYGKGGSRKKEQLTYFL